MERLPQAKFPTLPSVRPTSHANAIRAFYNSAQWQQARNAVKQAHPLCQHCLEAKVLSPTQEIHHNLSVKECFRTRDYASLTAAENLSALCRTCHAKAERKDNK